MAGGWRVTGARGSEDIVNGRFVPVMEVSVTTDDGTENRFRIPTAQYTPDTVKATIDEWYNRHMGIMGLNQ